MDDLKRLKELYEKGSKHSNYQIISKVLQEFITTEDVKVTSRYEYERLSYMLSNINVENKKILDIGANTGFFSFEFLENNAQKVESIEGNLHHAEFIKVAATLLNKEITVRNEYFNFDGELSGAPYDIVLLFNVLHHFGDDFGEKSLNIDEVKQRMKDGINYFWDKTEYLVLQFGYCWKGNRELLFFENGTKTEMINFVEEATENRWIIEKIAIAERDKNTVIYKDISKVNCNRNDSLGEFLNRPIFILKKEKDNALG